MVETLRMSIFIFNVSSTATATRVVNTRFFFSEHQSTDEVGCLNPRPTKGGGWFPLRFVSGLTKNAKESDPGHLGHLFYILCGHFDEKKPGGTPLRWG